MWKARYGVAVLALVTTTVLPGLRLTPTLAATNSIFSNNFDSQSTGALVTGTGANQFSGTSGSARLSVENTVVSSPPNALAAAVNGGGSAYAYTQYSSGYTTYDLTFNLRLGTDFTLPTGEYLVLAQTVPSTSSKAGKVSVVLPGVDHPIRLDYFDSAGTQHYLWGSSVVPPGGWHTVELRETVGAGSGSLALLVDGTTVAGGSHLDLGTQGLTWFAVGDEYTPPDGGTAGHLYIDDVTAAASVSAPAATPAPSTSTPIPGQSATPGATRTPPPTATPVPPTNTPPPTATHIPPTQTSVPAATSTPKATGSHAIKTVFLIVLENRNWSTIQGNTSEAPYINSLLAGANNSQTSYATQYYNPPGNHPSLPNYLWLEGGQCFSYCGTNTSPSASPGGISSSQHLVTLLKNAGISWKDYEEGISDGTCPLSANLPRQNAFVYFNDVNGSAAYCTTHDRSYADLATDLASNTVARYNFISPNVCHNMHDSCAPTNDAIKQGDTWLSTEVPKILKSQAYKNGGAVFITWDESAWADGPIGMIVLSSAARGHGYHNALHYTHSSTLRTLEEIYGVSPLLGAAQNATDLRDLFAAFP